MKLRLTLGAVVLLALPLLADTNVSGTISSSTTWTLANSPYIVTGNLDVSAAGGPVLTIEAGVVVKVNSGVYINIGNTSGGLIANGTAVSPIRITSNQGTVTPGYWCGLQFTNPTAATALAYVTVEGGGSCSEGGVIVR